MVARGELVRLSRGVYRSVTWPDSWQARWSAALLTVGDDTAVSHRAAAWLHGLTHVGVGARPELELTTPTATDTRIPDVTIHAAVHVTTADLTIVDGFRATTVAWTLASLARRLTPQRFERGVDAAVAAERLTFDEFAAVALRFRWCPGMATIREVLQRHVPDVRLTRSHWERLFLRWMHEDGLPAPVPNHPVIDDDGNRRLLDAAWPDYLVCAEVDLHPEHRRALGRNADGRRQNALVSQWTVLRFDELDMRFGRAQVLAEVPRAARRGRPGVSPAAICVGRMSGLVLRRTHGDAWEEVSWGVASLAHPHPPPPSRRGAACSPSSSSRPPPAVR